MTTTSESSQLRGTSTTAPVATKEPHRTTLHGDTRVDDYFWLRNKDTPEVTAYLQAENRYAESVLGHTQSVQETLYREMLGRIKQTDLSVPVFERGYHYYARTEEGKQYAIYCRRPGTMDAPEEILLDLNEFAETHKFVGIGTFQISNDGTKLAYSLDSTGFREYTLHVKDLVTGKHGSENIEKVRFVAFSADGQTLFYTVDDHAKRPYRVYRHRLGADPAGDELIYEESDERFRAVVWRSRSREIIFVRSESMTTSEVHYVPADRPDEKLRTVAARTPDHEYSVEHGGDHFFIRTNDKGRNFRIVSAPVRDPQPANWRELIPHSDDIMRTSLKVFRKHYVVHEREGGLPHVRVVDRADASAHRLPFPEPTYTVYGGQNPEYDSDSYRYSYQSLITPRSVFNYHIPERRTELLKETEVLGGYDRSQYVSEWLYASAADGARIPVSLVHKRGTPRDGSAPVLLRGYGAYGISSSARFSSASLSLLDRGVVVAIAHVRGGGEMGKTWHDQGRMFHKKNTFSDFIAAAEYLISSRYTSSDRLVITGGSAGGLLMGAVTNMRPDLFKAVVSHVPFVDVINTMSDDDMPLTVGEFEEWGNPRIAEQYEYMKSYCPYSNIEAKDYPAILMRTSLNDSQVMYWEPAKYVAKMRTLKTDRNPLILTINMTGGHGGSSGRYDRLREVALDYAFVLWQVGLHEPKAAGVGEVAAP